MIKSTFISSSASAKSDRQEIKRLAATFDEDETNVPQCHSSYVVLRKLMCFPRHVTQSDRK